MSFLSRLLGPRTPMVKDPELGKLRYLESAHGPVWAATIKRFPTVGVFDVFISSEEVILRANDRKKVLDVLHTYDDMLDKIKRHYKLLSIQDSLARIRLQFIYVPNETAGYDVELLFSSTHHRLNVFIKALEIIEVDVEEILEDKD